MAASRETKKKDGVVTDNPSAANSLESVLSSIRAFSLKHGEAIWFRGHESLNYVLRPNLYRGREQLSKSELIEIEKHLNNRFRDRGIPFHFHEVDPTGDTDLAGWRRFFTMQHYGIPTRLLDWTENALTALCFATLNNSSEGGAALWCLAPNQWNKIGSGNHMKTISIGDHHSKPYAPLPTISPPMDGIEWPMATFGMHNNPRISRQQGTFVVFAPGVALSMEEHYKQASGRAASADCILQIRISEAGVKSIKKDLQILGFNNSSMYPDLSGLASDLKASLG